MPLADQCTMALFPLQGKIKIIKKKTSKLEAFSFSFIVFCLSTIRKVKQNPFFSSFELCLTNFLPFAHENTFKNIIAGFDIKLCNVGQHYEQPANVHKWFLHVGKPAVNGRELHSSLLTFIVSQVLFCQTIKFLLHP